MTTEIQQTHRQCVFGVRARAGLGSDCERESSGADEGGGESS